MKRSKQIANRFREVILSGDWIANTNLKSLLSDVNWQMAITPAGQLNTIGTLAQHIHYYIAGTLNVLQGGDLLIKDKFSFDFPPITSQKDWEQRLKIIIEDAETFALEVEKLSSKDLDKVFVKEAYGTYERNIEAIIEHSYYHLGQISLLKKLVLSSR
ncbi:DUF1572 domain-containing protein [Mangrovimonas sp. YM274]|uniref:DUF1572 domain-containing protein n=1 Tax=Mangrovimonas sp. YM274 TaxID=3070660 RepID=UPI0027DC5E92|nr:DUF1572 domain-containing protein [Mangrovimonas sp. YM274]WMI69968.1 DUF1572 domain-containing protein [Mangrovimonas sp. YM274]